MKRLVLMIIPALICGVLFTSCDSDETESKFTNGLWLKMGDNAIVSTSDIDFYDVSTHMIYLKKELPYLKNVYSGGKMSVYVDHSKIYECSFHSLHSSSLPQGAFIMVPPIFYSEDIIRISFMQIIDLNGKPQFTDPRSDKQIIAALKNNHLYHEGLHCEIQSVNYLSGKLILNIELSNPDTFDYYYLDPDKMGIGLFHYFTNGPTFLDDQYQRYNHKETVVHPESFKSWEKEWLTLIKSGERKNISITYNHFDEIPTGTYRVNFAFPGLSWVSQKDRIFGNGRIWMGSISIEKDVTFQ